MASTGRRNVSYGDGYMYNTLHDDDNEQHKTQQCDDFSSVQILHYLPLLLLLLLLVFV